MQGNPSLSTREVAAQLNLPSHQVVWRTLKKHKYRPWAIHISQTLHPGDHERRLAFCTFVNNQIQENPNFLNNVMWSDECKFTNAAMFNRHNERYWSIENPHQFQERRPQIRFSLNVWVGLLGDTIIGPYIYEETLNADRYLNFLRTFLTDFIDDNVPLHRLNAIWFQQDGAPPHNARKVGECLSEMFPNHVIANNGDVLWPARSPDMSPLDYFLWGTMKNNIYKTLPADLDELRQRIVTTLRHKIRRRDVSRAIANLRKRVALCLELGGGQFEHML